MYRRKTVHWPTVPLSANLSIDSFRTFWLHFIRTVSETYTVYTQIKSY